MIRFILLIFTVSLFSCNNPHEGKGNHQTNDSAIASYTEIEYTRAELLQFFDSIGNSVASQIQPILVKYADSIFSNHTVINRTISASNFEKLKQAVELGMLDLKTGNEIFNFPIDSHFIKDGSIEIEFIPFDKSRNKFGKFAIVIGSLISAWENDTYFFDGPVLLAKHHNLHRNGHEINWFIDSDKNTVIYYLENFIGGSGIWQYNFFFYKYYKGRLIPVLNILENGNLHWSSADLRHFWFETTVVQTVPLKLKFQFNDELIIGPDNWIEIKKDSVVVEFHWDKKTLSYVGQFPDKINLTKIYSYYIDYNDDFYNICVDHQYLRSVLFGQDTVKSNAVLKYLNNVKNNLKSN